MAVLVDSGPDAALLELLTGPTPQAAKSFARRDANLDPLLLAIATASPQVTRNHYHHDFFPGAMMPQAEAAWDWTKYTGENSARESRKRHTYVSRQAPRRQRLASESTKENTLTRESDILKPADNLPASAKKRKPSVASSAPPLNSDLKSRQKSQIITESIPASVNPPLPPLEIKCMARTRIPTPHGPVFLHLYNNNRDNKEHLAIVVDPAQLSESSDSPLLAPPIRSRSLDAVWSDKETEMDRLIRGAYVGRLSKTSQRAFRSVNPITVSQQDGIPPPMIRIHSECFTGETIGSKRCDCGEQLDEAIRQISQPIKLASGRGPIPGRGAIVYLRQEGRGIGLLSKIRAYNLQDMGHDTVTANLLLGHKADERGYEMAGAILRDLGLGGTAGGVRVLTNNPDKVRALEKESIHVAERVPMIPRSWQQRKVTNILATSGHNNVWQYDAKETRVVGDTGGAVDGEDLDNYLRTKVLKMGHMLPLWMEQ